jgi:predicted DNA-binding transcriptional regulator AlpA
MALLRTKNKTNEIAHLTGLSQANILMKLHRIRETTQKNNLNNEKIYRIMNWRKLIADSFQNAKKYVSK